MAEIMTYADDTDQPQEISQHIVISRDKSVYVPEIIRKSIVYRDHNVERLTFDCPRYWSGIDISELNIYVNYIAEGQKKKGEDPGSFLCENVVVDEDNTDIFHFDWRITSNASEFPDKLIFLVCAKSVDSDGNEDVHWNSHLCRDLEVQEGLEASDSIVKKYPDVIESILSKLGKQIELRNSGTAIQYRNAGENIWTDLVQLEDIKGDAAVIIESNFKGSDTTANITEKTGETGDKWYSTDEGVYYMLSTSGEWINCGSGENLKKIEDEIDALKGDISQLSEEIANKTGTGLSTEAIDKLEEVGNYLAYTTADGGSKWTELISILRNGSSGGGSGETEVTLTGISATYTGGDVTVGTALENLTGIMVTATYSDGSTANVTDYTLSGEIAEGSNTITVSYGGKTATFTVVGFAESTDEDFETNGWTNGTAYNIEWIDGYRFRDTDNGEPQAMSGRSITPFMPCQNASRLNIVGAVSGSIFWYDVEQNYLRYTASNLVVPNTPIPTDAYYFRLCVTNENTSAFVATPYRDDLLTETTAWESDKFYRMEYTVGQSINGTSGVVSADANRTVSSVGYCYGASTIQIYPYGSNIRVAFYDVDGEYLGGFGTFDTSTGVATVPETAKTFRYHDYSKVVGYNAWVKLS